MWLPGVRVRISCDPQNLGGNMTKEEFINKRTKIISRMLDNPDECGIYPTTKCFAAFDDLFDELTECKEKSWAQIHREAYR